jgi:hypothetical protein
VSDGDGDVKVFTGGGSGQVAIYNLSPGVIRYEFAATLIAMLFYEHNRMQAIGQKSTVGDVGFSTAGAILSIYRNVVTEEFLDGPHDWMFFLDSDMVLEPDTLEKLLEVADPETRPIVAGLYMMAQDDGNVPTICHWGKDIGTGKYRMHPRPGFIPEDELIEVDGTGSGCMLIHRNALLKMHANYGPPEPWYGVDTRDGTTVGEDYSFCLRAKDIGIPTFVRTGVRCGHAGKTVTLTTKMHNGPTLRGYDGRVHPKPPEPEV